MYTLQTNIKRRVKYTAGFSFIVAAMIVAFAVANVSAQVYPSGMVAYWKFDETSGPTAYDSSINGNNGTLVNSPIWSTKGKVGGALSFDGSNDYVEVPASDAFAIGSEFTIEAWIKPDTLTPYGHDYGYLGIVAKQYGYGGYNYNDPYMTVLHSDGSIGIHSALSEESGNGPWGWKFSSPGLVNTGVWTHIAWVWKDSNINFYVNGVIDSTTWMPIRDVPSYPILIGKWYLNWVDYVNFSGLMDEVAIYNRALTAEEIQQHYQNGLHGLGYEVVIPVPIDIKPGSFPNSINLRSKGNVPVAILSDSTFDATTVDRDTVVFAGASPLPIGQTPQDVNGDGLLDVVLHFKTQDLNLQLGDTEACLTGKTIDGQDFEGCDSVRIVK